MKAGALFSAGVMAIAVAALSMPATVIAAERPERSGEHRGWSGRSNDGGGQRRGADTTRMRQMGDDPGRRPARPSRPMESRSAEAPTRAWREARSPEATPARPRIEAARPQPPVREARDDNRASGWNRGDREPGNRAWNRGDNDRDGRAWDRGNGDRDGRPGNRGDNDRDGRTWNRDNDRNDRDRPSWSRGDHDRDNSRWRDNDRRDNDWRNDRNRHYRSDNHRHWDRDGWRRDNRYDWRRYRDRNRSVYRIGRYYAPYHGYSYRRVSIGFSLGSLFYGNRYWINDPWSYRLPAVYGPYRWVRYYDDVLLVNVYTGEVVDVIYDFFW